VTVSGSLTYGLAKWLDSTLQEVISRIPYTVPSSKDFVSQIHLLNSVSPNALLCTFDVSSMYTHIDTNHAFVVLEELFHTSPLWHGLNWRACLDAICICTNTACCKQRWFFVFKPQESHMNFHCIWVIIKECWTSFKSTQEYSIWFSFLVTCRRKIWK